ncbi:hypothetical protein OUZ56_009259 [Daphnia magna]|uniref:F-box domain-containing protein n=1 Tax=Daphnia magna TaxID=35525 RepID=A0ABR0AFG4_9CRUS|nr:hypothetical protein OUZ56_009259 [Daphnia magna]
MVGAAWKQDNRGKGIYVDHEATTGEEEERECYVEDKSQGNWAELPDLVIERIFSYLNNEKRYYSSLVCRRWYQAFHLPYVWSTFVLEDRVLSRRRFNYHLGWQYTLDHYRAQIFLYKTAKNIRTLIFAPMLNFFNLFEVMNMLSQFSERYPGSLDNIHTLKFTFNCDMAFRTENAIYGTGGQLLQALKKLMSFLPGLTSLELTNLLLDSSEALYLLDDVCYTRCLNLHSLTLINCTKVPCRLLHPGAFLRLHSLRISPQTLSPDLLWLIGCTKLQHLHVIQNAYTESCYSIDSKAWTELNQKNPALKVHLKSTGKTKREIIWQERAPVSSILYNSRYSKVTMPSILTVVDLYRNRLKVYGHLGLPRFHTSNSFQHRIDMALITLVRECPNLHTLVIRERISTATLILLVSSANCSSLRRLYVRRNALLLRADWPRSLEWTEDYYSWLKTTSRSYEATQVEVSNQLRQPDWQALNDQQFKILKVNVEIDSC